MGSSQGETLLLLPTVLSESRAGVPPEGALCAWLLNPAVFTGSAKKNGEGAVMCDEVQTHFHLRVSGNCPVLVRVRPTVTLDMLSYKESFVKEC